MTRAASLLAACGATVILAACGSSSSSSTGAPSGATNGHGGSFIYNAAGASADFTHALGASYLKVFDDQFNFHTVVDPFCCGITKLQAMENTGNVTWSAIQWANSADFKLAEAAGLLQPLNTKIVPLSLLQRGTYDKYGYQVYTTGILLGWLPRTYPPGSPHPTNFEDLFNTAKFPGKRCMYQGVQDGGVFEGAELAAGVAPSRVYPINFPVAFRELNKIRSDIVWWTSGSQASQFLLNGTCKLGVIWSGVAQGAAGAGNPIDVTWGHGITVYGMNAIPKGAPNSAGAQQLLGLILKNQAAQRTFEAHTAYTEPLKDPPKLPPSIAKWAPQGANVATAVQENDNYYSAHSAAITKAFNDWLVTGK